MSNLKAKLAKAVKGFKKTTIVEPESVQRLKKAIEASQQESAALKREKG